MLDPNDENQDPNDENQDPNDENQDPNDENQEPQSVFTKLRKNRTAQILALAGVGAVAGPLLLTAGFYAVGLSTAGPIAGGWFASNMGAGLVAGGVMSSVQSAAMTTATYTTAAWIGLGTGSVAGTVATAGV
jgi:hypothetical protein